MKTRALLIAVLLMQGCVAAAQGYPTRPIRLIVPASAGGGTDLVARVLAQKFNEALGQPVVVDNRGGAGTTLGADIASKAPADGYTIMMHHTSLAFNATFYRKLPYDTAKDFTPISLVAQQPFLVVVHPSLPVKSIRELVRLAKAHPGQIAYGSGGAGSGPFMATALFKQSTGLDILHVPYKGAGPAFNDLTGGQVQMMIATISLSLPNVRAGRVRALAVTSEKRVGAIPEIPTVDESGIRGYSFVVWYGLFAPAGTPHQIISRLNDETAKIVEDGETGKKLAVLGLEMIRNSPEAFASFFQHEIERWGKVVKAAKIHAN